jgi:membrane dipeptidase
MLNFRLTLFVALLSVPVIAAAQSQERQVQGVSQQAFDIHHSGMLFDGHNDLPWQVKMLGQSSFDVLDISKPQPKVHTDIARLRTGGVKAQFWSVYVRPETATTGDSLLQTMEQIDVVHRMVRRYPETFEMADTADDIQRIAKSGKIASMMGIEGGYSIHESLPILRRLYDQGCRYMTLTHSKSLAWADSATDEPRTENGLSPFGEEVIREMNRLGMLIDLSHVSDRTMKRSLEISKAPVIFSHSSARAINDHSRNVNDEVLRLTAANSGVVMVNFYPGYVTPTERLKKDSKDLGTLSDVVDHIEHIIKVAGIDHVGIGSDFDGVGRLPVGLEDVSTYPRITQELLNRGHEREAIHKILGGNVLRVLREAEEVAASLKAS